MRLHRRAGRWAAVLGLAVVAPAVASLAVAPAAQAGTITVPFVCTTNGLGGAVDQGAANFSVTVTGPTQVPIGTPIAATYSFGAVPTGLPFALTGVSVSSTATVIARKQTTGSPSASATSAASPTTIVGGVPAYGTVSVPPTSVSIATTAFTPGDVAELVPDEVRLNYVTSGELGPGAFTSCVPVGPVPRADRVTIGNGPFVAVDRCVAYNSNLSGGPGCTTTQQVQLSLTQGRLVQRAYLNTTPATGSLDGSGVTAPIAGTSNVNSSATQVNLGSITSPLAPATIVGTLNDVTVSDSRGGTFGWTLSATMTTFGGVGGNTIAASRLVASPTCTSANASNAWDYDATGQTPISGFNPAFVAPGASAGPAGQPFGSPVTLCVKDTTENLTTGSTGGVWNIGSPLTLTVPSFQAADRYTAVMTITLA